MKKTILIFAFSICLANFSRATEWQTFMCYYAVNTSEPESEIPFSFTYLQPTVYFECIGLSVESYVAAILGKLHANKPNSPVFQYDYDDIGVEILDKSIHLTLSLDVTEIELDSLKDDKNELIASILLSDKKFRKLYLKLKGGEVKVFTKRDIEYPYFKPINFQEDLVCF